MFNKNQRILWLLNHRTLMPYECALMQRLGFEVFVPKVIPANNFRSGAVDFSYDSSLSIPAAALARLNEFNFYEHVWPADIVTIVNRYFGTVFMIPYGRQIEEVVDKFEGQIVFRAFGLDASRSYRDVLGLMYGSAVQRKIEGIASRFWFGEGYDNLHEIESPLFVERSLFLPIGVPDVMWKDANEWRGTEQSILFLCPNAVTDPYYSGIYDTFKQKLGDLPHVIIGAQDVPVDDPNVRGFISDSELERLYLDCAVLYYPSTEPRHVHYSPIEAAIKGMPVVFFQDSLLDRLSRGVVHGRVSSAGEARALVERILEGDTELIESIRTDQREISFHFSDAYCSEVWRANMEASGFNAALGRAPGATTVGREVLRTLMRPIAHGRTRIDPHRQVRRPQRVATTAAEAAVTLGSTLADGIDFTQKEFPLHVLDVSGVGWGEGWGRWSIAERVTISLGHVLSGSFRLRVRAFGYGPNVGVPTKVKVGSQTRLMELDSDADHDGTFLHFHLPKPSNVLEITVPKPIMPPNDNRSVGIAFVEIRELATVTRTAAEANSQLGCSLADGIDFALAERPPFVDAIEGLDEAEHWGRWSTGRHVAVELNHTLHGRVRLAIRAITFGKNVGAPVKVHIGDQQRVLRVPGSHRPDDESFLDFDLRKAANRITLTVPHPTMPPNDHRTIGLGLISLRVV